MTLTAAKNHRVNSDDHTISPVIRGQAGIQWRTLDSRPVVYK